jgi:hypothetical protein
MRQSPSLKPQDVVIVLKIIAKGDRPWKQLDIAKELGLSQGEVTFALDRLLLSGLINHTKRTPQRLAIAEFLIHGLKYIFPAKPGAISRGIPTAHSCGPLAKKIVSSEEDQYVWPDEDGTVRGQSIQPLYETVPKAVKNDEEFHILLALVDAIRIGRARDKVIATNELRKRIGTKEAGDK